MKPMRTLVVAATVLIAASAGLARAQRGNGASNVPSQPAPSGMGNIPYSNTNRSGFPMNGSDPMMGMPDPMKGRLAEQQAKVRNNERQKKLQTDTERLVGLVNELKTQVQSEQALPAAELSKRAEEIEKLARSVKDRMKG